MKKTVLALFLLVGLLVWGPLNAAAVASEVKIKAGDIIFQELAGGQNLAVRLVTGSRYTHCGIIMESQGELAVYEAIGPVDWKPVDKWIERGVDGHYVVMRLKDDSVLTVDTLAAMMQSGAELKGRPYDLWFQWSDDNIYCSELVWKMYARGAGINLAGLHKFSDYDNVRHPEVQRLADQRYPGVVPWDEEAVAPSDLMGSSLLYIVDSN